MKRLWLALFIALSLSHVETANAAHASHHSYSYHLSHAHSVGRTNYSDGRPFAWCGWFLRKQVPRDPGPEYNLARQWLNYGTKASGPLPGVIAVWPHHVAMIVGHLDKPYKDRHGRLVEWITHEGNWSHREHLGPRSLSGVIGWRNS